MTTELSFNIIKKIQPNDTPFDFALYNYKSKNKILIENFTTGRVIEIDSYRIGEYIHFTNLKTSWKQFTNNSFIKFNDDKFERFTPLYPESNRFVNITTKTDKRLIANFSYFTINDPNDSSRTLQMVNTSVTSEKNTYSYIFKNIKDFEVPNFKLITSPNTRQVDENFKPTVNIEIVCKVPFFQLYSIIIPSFEYNSFRYSQPLTVMKYNNLYYRFPYGNSSNADGICLGIYQYENTKIPDSIEELAYSQIVTSKFNGDYNPHIKCDIRAQTTLDFQSIKEKINNDDFTISYIDVLFYLSQCETLEEINMNLFILSPNIPLEIQKLEAEI
jgi:hypothetical protein